jgi:4-hydroxy-3-methylbut-2-enyl diphosphate reductase
LREVAQHQGVESYMVDDASHLDPAWIAGKQKIGVSAGASAPEVLVQEVISKLQALGAAEVAELQGVVENVVFQLPKNLTKAMSTTD